MPESSTRGDALNVQAAGPVNPEPAKPARQRIDSIDLLRGIVMVIMMLEAGAVLVRRLEMLGKPMVRA